MVEQVIRHLLPERPEREVVNLLRPYIGTVRKNVDEIGHDDHIVLHQFEDIAAVDGHDRHIAVGNHIDRQFVVAAEKKGRCNQLGRFDRFDVRTAPRCIGHFAVYFPLDDDHEPCRVVRSDRRHDTRSGRIYPCRREYPLSVPPSVP